MIRIVPNTTVRPITWTDSMSGKRYREFRMPVARRETERANQGATSTGTRSWRRLQGYRFIPRDFRVYAQRSRSSGPRAGGSGLAMI